MKLICIIIREGHMDLKQLEYFVIACEKKSFNKTAECLCTTQPNVSKIILSLEKELGRKLFERTSKGLIITPYGAAMQEHAHIILKNTGIIHEMADKHKGKKFSIATYIGCDLSELFVNFIKNENQFHYNLEHRQGTAEEICNAVSAGMSDLGLVYYAQKKAELFRHVLNHKKLEFHFLCSRQLCVFMGENNSLYDKEQIEESELKKLKFIRSVRDYYDVSLHFNIVSLSSLDVKALCYPFFTSTDTDSLHFLQETNLCDLNLDILQEKTKKYPIKALPVQSVNALMEVGFVTLQNTKLNETAKNFMRLLAGRI